MTITENTSTDQDAAAADEPLLPPTTPGEVLAEEFLIPLGISAYRLAADLGVPRTRVGDIIAGKRAITADTALRLARYFGTTERFWLELQTRHDVEVARDALGGQLGEITPRA